jgi:large subunit ribosomal protein L29
MRAADLREKNVEDLNELRKSLVHDVFQNRLKNFTNRLDDTSAIHKTKRDLARVITLLRERELGTLRPAAPQRALAPKTAEPVAEKKEKIEKTEEVERVEAKAPSVAKPKAKKSAASPPKAIAGKGAAREKASAKDAPKKKSAKKSEAK